MNDTDVNARRSGRAAAVVAGLLGFAGIGAVAFIVVFLRGANVQASALALGTMFAALAAALVVWERLLMKHAETTEEREPMPSARPAEDRAEVTFVRGAQTIAGRRTWLVRLLGAIGGLIGIAALLPLRSLVQANAAPLTATSWKRGLRLVRADGSVVRSADLELNSIVTVFPEGHVGTDEAATSDMATTATVLVRVPAAELQLGERASWAPQGFVAYSKVCTHAGCPVAIYRAQARQLFCPCHQSTFDVLRGGRNIFGPADRPLPQLPIHIDAGGALVADGDFPEPIGPGYWDRS